MKYTLTRHEKWIRIAEVEADNEDEARQKFDDGDTLWDETIYVEISPEEPTSCEQNKASDAPHPRVKNSDVLDTEVYLFAVEAGGVKP